LVKITCHPLTPERWPDLEKLFGAKGACGGCWCMTWRLKRRDWEEGKGEANKQALRAIVERDERPGVIAYADDEPIGWCSVAPREVFVALARSRVLAPIDATPVWSISCLFVAKGYRRQGISVKLIEAAVDFAAQRGAKVVEAYPVTPYAETIPAAFAWTGLPAAYLQAGFVEVARRSNARPVMRRQAEQGKRGRRKFG
jgi:GNAT superfamily N-acetyltransferase